MTTPAHPDPWEPDDRPTAREDLPPGFYFPPGHAPAPKPGSTNGLRWALAVVVLLLVVAVGVAAYLFV